MKTKTCGNFLCILPSLSFLAQLWKSTLMYCWMAIPILYLLFTQILHSHRLLHNRNLLPYLKPMSISLLPITENVLREELEKFAENLILMHRLQLHFFSQLGNIFLIELLLQIQMLCSNSVLWNLLYHWQFSLYHTLRFFWNSWFIDGSFVDVGTVLNFKKNHFCF